MVIVIFQKKLIFEILKKNQFIIGKKAIEDVHDFIQKRNNILIELDLKLESFIRNLMYSTKKSWQLLNGGRSRIKFQKDLSKTVEHNLEEPLDRNILVSQSRKDECMEKIKIISEKNYKFWKNRAFLFELKYKQLLRKRKPFVKHVSENRKFYFDQNDFFKKKMRINIKNLFRINTNSILKRNLLRLAYVRIEPRIGFKNIFKLEISKFVKESDEYNKKFIDKLRTFIKKYSITNNMYIELTAILNSVFDRNMPTFKMIKNRK